MARCVQFHEPTIEPVLSVELMVLGEQERTANAARGVSNLLRVRFNVRPELTLFQLERA